MKKRIISSYLLSLVCALSAFVVIAMKLTGEYRWQVATVLYVIGWICLFLAVHKHRRSRVMLKRERRKLAHALVEHRRFVGMALFLALTGYVLWVLFPEKTDALALANPTELAEDIEADLARLSVCIDGIEATATTVEAERALFETAVTELTAAELESLLQLWARHLAYAVELERIKYLHQHFYQINYLQHPELNLRSFLAAYAAFVADYKNTLRLLGVVANRPHTETMLNERIPVLDVPANAYLTLKLSVTSPDTLVRLHAGRANLAFLRVASTGMGPEEERLIAYAEKGYTEILAMLGEQPELFVEAPKDMLESISFEAWFPFQKGVAEGMSRTRTVRRENFISLDDLEALKGILEPGDLLLQRRNWYLTNVGIPGFWPHVALYTGSLEEMDAYFEGHTAGIDGSVSAYISQAHPELHAELVAPTKDGYTCRIIEALAPGIIPTPLEISGRADYMAVLRPNLPKQAKLQALLQAFSYYQRPYDYAFDFATDNALVCSELVFKAYRPDAEGTGLHFTLQPMAGRMLLPPNHIARKFAQEFSAPHSELKFVAFLDGQEKDASATRKDVDDFRRTWKRPKWDVAQE